MIKKKHYVWLPRGLEGLAPWFANFALKFAQFAATLGFTAADVAMVESLNATVQWLAAAMPAMDANASGLRTFRDETLYGEKNDPKPAEPVTVLPASPAEFATAIIEKLATLVGRVELADNYTEEIGAQLGIVVAPSSNASPASVKPTLQAFSAQSGYEFASVIANRGESDMNDVEIRRKGSEIWTSAKKGTGKSVNVKVEPTVEGQPEQIQARVQLYRKNEKYGQPSDAVYVTLNP